MAETERMARAKGGFTLVELLIVVSLIGLLSSIAIPSFLRYQLRSKTSEVFTNIAALAITEEIHRTEKGGYKHVASPAPAAIPGSTHTQWVGNADFEELGWRPAGEVYFQYLVSADTVAGGRFTIEAASDIDADGVVSYFGYVHPAGGSGIAGRLAGSSCVGTGVYDPSLGTQTATRVAGACDSASGKSVF